MSRPSARAKPGTVGPKLTGPTKDELEAHQEARIALKAKEHRALLRRATAVLREHGRMYSVDLGRIMELPPPKAKTLLLALERCGRATSEIEPSPLSGNGRRYYQAVMP